MRAQSVKHADPVNNRSVNNIRLTFNMSGLTTVCNRLGLGTAETTLGIDYMKHNLIRLRYII